MTDIVVPQSTCPYCGYKTDRATSMQGEQTPSPGSISVCIQCAGLTIFADDMTLRRMTARELIELQTSSEWPLIERVRAVTKLANLLANFTRRSAES